MSTDPTSMPPAPLPVDPMPFKSGGEVADFAVSNRTTIAYLLVIIGLACLGGSIYCFYKAYNADESIAKRDADKEKDKKTDPAETDKEKDKEKKSKLDNPHLTEYISGAFIGLLGAVAGLGVAAYTLAATPKLTYAESLTDARKTLLLAGSLIGVVLMVGGLWFAAYYFSSLTKALDGTGKLSELKWVVGPLAVLLLGAGLLFLSVQPARAEERNNDLLRKLIYGSNFALTTFLIVVILLVVNIFVAIKVPNKLDTTESGLYSLELNDLTKEYLAGLNKPVKVYAILPESDNPIIADTLRLLDACVEANPSRFKVRKLSPTYDTKEIKDLRNKYPLLDQSDYGLLFTLDDGDKQAGFIRLDEMMKQDTDPSSRRSKISFEGEAKIARELLALNESKNRAIVYFTAGHGELDVVPQPPQMARREANRPATRLRAMLEKSNVEVRPLEFDLVNPKVPDDATIVVIADPRAAFSKPQADALQKYMTAARPEGGKGKLVVLASPFPKADGSGVADTGLSGLAASLGVELGQNYLMNDALESLGYGDVQALISRALLRSRNPIALAFRPPRGVILPNCREVVPSGQPGGTYTVEMLFESYPPQRITWLESSPPANPAKSLDALLKDPAVAQSKEASNRSVRGVGVLVSEGSNGRAVILGSGEGFADPDGQNRARYAENNAEFFAAAINWLRDRPAVANISGKTYGEYHPPKTADDVRIFWLPFGVTLLGVIALGAGVWVSRRK